MVESGGREVQYDIEHGGLVSKSCTAMLWIRIGRDLERSERYTPCS